METRQAITRSSATLYGIAKAERDKLLELMGTDEIRVQSESDHCENWKRKG